MVSFISCSSLPVVSFASSLSQPLPQITFTTFQPAPRNRPSSSWMILPLPITGPSRRCRLQLIRKHRLSSFSRAAKEIAPRDSGSSISPSPRKAYTRCAVVSFRPRPFRYFRKRA
ncbi:Uncharacterised protein [Vibrio cholerae]|nr:Uncharacterised protein [Vibrio cholerae]CSI52844.1 Uncharacterised protein [Vibrio cholerae]